MLVGLLGSSSHDHQGTIGEGNNLPGFFWFLFRYLAAQDEFSGCSKRETVDFAVGE